MLPKEVLQGILYNIKILKDMNILHVSGISYMRWTYLIFIHWHAVGIEPTQSLDYSKLIKCPEFDSHDSQAVAFQLD
jgi:hypothetical protein